MSCGVLWHSAELLKSNYGTNYEISIRHLAPHAAPDGAQNPPRCTRWAEEQGGRHLNSVQILWLTHPCSLRFRRAVSTVHDEIAASFLRSFFLSSCMLCNISFLLAIWHNIKIIIRFDSHCFPSLSLSPHPRHRALHRRRLFRGGIQASLGVARTLRHFTFASLPKIIFTFQFEFLLQKGRLW